MTDIQALPGIHRPEELHTGEYIEAWRGGRLLDAGTVSRMLPSVSMAWIVCARTGTLKLVDLETTVVVRVGDAGPRAQGAGARRGCRRRAILRSARPKGTTAEAAVTCGSDPCGPHSVRTNARAARCAISCEWQA
ncbi:hypothetical protein [Arthrobacter wenxiniae]|uniref:Uncharacterized protein n=1 Tax=Arthrobacter wenxiniae TaxID=2713570 RepID=A0A7Y7II99_9MICC|nr:hypothetical protein [Arthrobacter wenxiniae]NVM95803.1 hypothetical protein [Arthrobacter wenxiniae]